MVATTTKDLYESAGNWPTIERESNLSISLLMDRLVDLLIEKAKVGLHWPDLYSHAEQVLNQMDGSTNDHRSVFRRLKNARRYASASEYGAAMFELRMMRSHLLVAS
jgi:hypothetical protein